MKNLENDIEVIELERLWGSKETWVLIKQKSRDEAIVLNPSQLSKLNQNIQKIISSNTMEECNWTLDTENWPEFKNPDDKFRTAEALSLLISSEFVIPLAAKTPPSVDGTQKSVVGLYVNCSDIFYPAADAEPLPLIGFTEQDEQSFWELYYLARKHGFLGVTKWVSLKRKALPMFHMKNKLKELIWCDKLQSIEDSQEQES